MKNRGWFFGVFFIIAAILLIVLQIGDFTALNTWTIIATLGMGVIIIQSLIWLNFFGIFIPLAVLYSLYQSMFGLPHIQLWILIISAVLLSIGFETIFHNTIRGYRMKGHNSHDNHAFRHVNNWSKIEDGADEDNPSYKVLFSEGTKYLRSNNLTSGFFSTNFGSMNLYMDQVTVNPEGATLRLDCSFGGIKLFVPRGWQINNEIRPFLGDVDMKHYYSHAQERKEKLTLVGNVSFGSVQIIMI